jgi:RNA polymerase sigma factor (TIGR02999 family)
MRRILTDWARSHQRAKRGGSDQKLSLNDVEPAAAGRSIDLVALDDALARLAALDARQARLVELRYFGGLTIEEAGEALAVSPSTARRDWTLAKAWLRRELSTGNHCDV